MPPLACEQKRARKVHEMLLFAKEPTLRNRCVHTSAKPPPLSGRKEVLPRPPGIAAGFGVASREDNDLPASNRQSCRHTSTIGDGTELVGALPTDALAPGIQLADPAPPPAHPVHTHHVNATTSPEITGIRTVSWCLPAQTFIAHR